MSSTLQDLVNRAVFYSTEVQTHFGGLIADAEWEVDFGADPHLTFSSSDGVVLRARPHLLGSESSRDKTWLWGWENVNDFPEAVVGLSHEVRKFGAAEEVAELTTAELDLDEELALRLTLAAKEATGKWAHYPAGAGAGTTVWLLIESPEITLPEPQVKVSVRALMQGLTQTTVSDHRAAIDAYVAKRGIPVRELPDGGLRMLFADGSADLSFDSERRISNCDMNTPLEGEAAEQFAVAGHTPAEATPSTPTPSAGASADTRPAVQSSPAGSATTPSPAEAAPTSGAGADSATGPGSRDSVREEPAAPSAEEHSPADSVPAEEPAADDSVDSAAAERAAAEPQPQSSGEDEHKAEEPSAKEDKPKKKGLFSKLFGR
ncbi:DUF6882 domain-containing protein [Brevibacterium spongiae]|uniref:Uncharacterized protein n=1 Tax=Brevibacterium spongiae TaxID=2909672 RepID=A0ABY5SQG1_9MICO|nr:DUF6882 domain-containing protein [Brevibacterium spongiae]UVI36778.1 hypothetical protein L1F31_03710 [Brevibacterium spongiae]